MKLRLTISLLVLLCTIHPTPTRAQWRLDGVPVSTAYGYQQGQRSVSDGAGGAIIAWVDLRSSVEYDVYVRRISAAGVPLWTTDGVVACTAANDQIGVRIVSDGAGGAIMTWSDLRSGSTYDIYAQRINASGVVQWGATGVGICTAANSQYVSNLIADGAGGAIISWVDLRGAVNFDIYAQRINSVGVVQWLANGVAISTAAGDQYSPVITSDGATGAIIAWQDYRSGSNLDVYAQRINGAGAVQWAANGILLCNAANNQDGQAIVADGSGGAIIAWHDARGGTTPDIYAQRVNAAGTVQWVGNGALVCGATVDQINPALVSDGAAGAIVTWTDYRSGASDVYAQRILANSSPMWTYDGVVVCNAPSTQYGPSIVADGLGGAVMAWMDFRSSNYDVYAQQLTASGEAKWTANGVSVTTAPSDQNSPSIVLDAGTGAIVTWDDRRSGGFDCYAQRVEFRYGFWGKPEPQLASAADVKADQGGHVKLNWYASGRDALDQQVISHYSIWRAIDAAAVSNNALVSLSDVGKQFAGPVFRSEKTPTVDYFWELIGTQDAIYRTAYSFVAETRYDSTATGAANHQFQIVAHAYYSQYINWPSNVLAAHSVDNLAPAAPLLLTAQRIGNYVYLTWNRVRVPDLRDYSVYRKTSSGVTPVPINFLSSANDTVLTDETPPASALYYIVTAYDVHANQGAPSNEASVQAATGIGNTPPITALTVLQNQPNPFAGTTNLLVGLPASSDLSIEVYDVAGRRVRAQTLAQQPAGWRSIPFDGHTLASGVYFYRVSANGKTATTKMVIAR